MADNVLSHPAPTVSEAATPQSGSPGVERLIPALPPGPYIVEPEDIDRFYVRIQEDGTLFFKGSRPRIEAFLQACEEIGLELRVGHIAFCG